MLTWSDFLAMNGYFIGFKLEQLQNLKFTQKFICSNFYRASAVSKTEIKLLMCVGLPGFPVEACFIGKEGKKDKKQ